MGSVPARILPRPLVKLPPHLSVYDVTTFIHNKYNLFAYDVTRTVHYTLFICIWRHDVCIWRHVICLWCHDGCKLYYLYVRDVIIIMFMTSRGWYCYRLYFIYWLMAPGVSYIIDISQVHLSTHTHDTYIHVWRHESYSLWIKYI
jgi:hypothetical protein